MNGVIGEVLPLAMGVAISPLPMMAAILTLFSLRAKAASRGFLIGWLAGVIAAVSVFAMAGSVIPQPGPGVSNPIGGAIRIVLGCLLALLALKQWNLRPPAGIDPAPPSWMEAIDTMTPLSAAGFAALLAVANPKNLVLSAGAGIAISGHPAGDALLTIMLFTAIASLPVAVPITISRAEGEDVAAQLDRLRNWLLHHNAAITTVVLSILAVVMVGKGIATF